MGFASEQCARCRMKGWVALLDLVLTVAWAGTDTAWASTNTTKTECKRSYQKAWNILNSGRNRNQVKSPDALIVMYATPGRLWAVTEQDPPAPECASKRGEIVGGECPACGKNEWNHVWTEDIWRKRRQLLGSEVAVLIGDQLRPCVTDLVTFIKPMLHNTAVFIHTTAKDEAMHASLKAKIHSLGDVVKGHRISRFDSRISLTPHCYDCGKQQYWMQWWRYQQTWRMMEEYEAEHLTVFSIVMRMRSDVIPSKNTGHFSISSELIKPEVLSSLEHVFTYSDLLQYGTRSSMSTLKNFVDGIRDPAQPTRYNLCCKNKVVDPGKDRTMTFNRMYYPTNWSALARSELCGPAFSHPHFLICQHVLNTRFPSALIEVGDNWMEKIEELQAYDKNVAPMGEIREVVTGLPPLTLTEPVSDPEHRFNSRGWDSDFINYLLDQGTPVAYCRFNVEMLSVIANRTVLPFDSKNRKSVCI